MPFHSVGTLNQRLRTLFTDRELIVRSDGKVRFIQISARAQKIAAGVAVGALGIWCASIGALTLSNASALAEQEELRHRAASIEEAEQRLQSYRQNFESKAAELAQRQQFIERMIDAHVIELPEDEAAKAPAANKPTEPSAQVAASQVSGQASGQVHSITVPARSPWPSMASLDRLEKHQLALVERITHYANERSSATADAIRELGLTPEAVMRNVQKAAEGGPLEQLKTSSKGSMDPRFKAMGQSLARMDALDRGYAMLPQVRPAHVDFVSSSYGYRADPFTGASAFHAGLDFPGPMGSAIYAAAKGKVTFVGQRQGYGNVVEITHGNGLMTRYAHLSGFRARVGQDVDGGTHIANMGSTGRSTGSHLHFEVRIHDRPVNPRPFLEAAHNTQKGTD